MSSFFVMLVICLFAVVPSLMAEMTNTHNDTVIVQTVAADGALSAGWKNALKSRISATAIARMWQRRRPLTPQEKRWEDLIVSKAAQWALFLDSLSRPFTGVQLPDTLFVLLGYLGRDDGFTFGRQTVCLDVTALQQVYGDATTSENNHRINRIFSHEYTHLLHKEWARIKHVQPVNFRDSILWECFYEGLGMYRSLNAKWLPVNGRLPQVASDALEKLYPAFCDNLIKSTFKQLTANEKKEIQAQLSRGSVAHKWGAFPVALWLAMEAAEDEQSLIYWINLGPAAVLKLAQKYLPDEFGKRLITGYNSELDRLQ